jgi:hypothetical protein
VHWLLVPLAFAAMIAQDVLGVLMVQAEAQYRAHRAGLLDMAQDACRMAGLAIGLGSIDQAVRPGGDIPFAAAVIAAILAADYIGTRSGTRLGQRLDHQEAR